MRMPHPTPTANPLPFEHYRGGITDDLGAPAGFAEIALSGPAVVQFDNLVHELYPDAARVDQTRLQQLAAWLLSLPEDQARMELEARLQRLDDLRGMLDDSAWDSQDAMRMRVNKLLAYIDREDDLIPDSLPLLGRLDDVLLIELAWPVFAEEADEYRDFCNYRQTERPSGTPDEQREAWLRDRLVEIELLRRDTRIIDEHFTDDRAPDDLRIK
ncbi:MAG TPA: YkvA family protein [Lysobacter sp.]|nr:YkvA family protein [Lysobacter sp.]